MEAATPQQQLRTIYMGPLHEFHYVSTKHLVPYICALKLGTQEVPTDAPETALSFNVRPHMVVQAAKWLINNSVLYKEEGIALFENWKNSQESDFDNSVHDKSECNPQVEASNTDSETLSTFNEGLLQV